MGIVDGEVMLQFLVMAELQFFTEHRILALDFKTFLAASYLGKRKLTSTLFTNKNKLFKIRLFQSFMVLPVTHLYKTVSSSLKKDQLKIWTISSLNKQVK